MKLGNGKFSKTENKLDNIKDLKNHNFNFKKKIKDLEKKVTHDKDVRKLDDGDKAEDDSEKFGRNQWNNKSEKNRVLGLPYYI